MPEYTIGQVVERIGLTRQRINVLCRQHGIGRLVGRVRILTETDLARLETCRLDPWRPKKIS